MNGTITTWFKDKGFGFIKDENGDNRYFHVIKVANPDLIKKDAAVTFEPTTNNKGLSAYAVKVVPESKYIYIAGERLKLTSIKSYLVYSEEVPADTRIDKENAVLSVGILMSSIKPKSDVKPGDMRSLKKLAITTFQGTTLIFSEDEIDIDATVKLLKSDRTLIQAGRLHPSDAACRPSSLSIRPLLPRFCNWIPILRP
jgi:cold shock CspA family protein